MILIFRKTGERRYAVEAEREGFPALTMDPAPGYDDHLPHDLMHSVVEAVLGLDRAVFGQLSSGGDAGTFRVRDSDGISGRQAARTRRRQKKRGVSLDEKSEDHYERSERATYLAWREWLSRSEDEKLRNKARAMSDQAASIAGTMETSERRLLEGSLDEICSHLDELSEVWRGLKPGEQLAVNWPELTPVRSGNG